MDFYNESIGYAVGWWGQAFRSNDGGITWEILPTPSTNDNFTDIHLLGANELWVSTNSNVVYYSATGGQSWSVMNIGSNGFGSFSSIVGVQGGDAWTVGYQGYIEHFTGPPPPPVNQPPAASFEFNATGLTVDFTDTSTDPDGFIVSWEWNFGDGNFSTQQHPTHTYDTANTYIVTLTVTDDDGDTGTAGRLVVVQPGPGGTYGDFTEVTPLDSLFVTPQDEDFWVITTAPADYDLDGDLDIAVLGYYVVYNVSVEDKLVLVRNEGSVDSVKWDFSYIDLPFGSLTSGSSDLAWGDVDGDTDMDLAVGTDGATVLYRNDSGNLILTDTQLPAYWEENSQAEFDLRSITWADFDNDGDQDLFIPSVFDDTTFSYRTALMRNDGPNTSGGWIFTETDSMFAATSHAQSSWADFDGDQDLDLLLINVAPLYDNGFIHRYRNDGNGVFTRENILENLSVERGEVQWGDYDGDGDLDVLVVGNLKEIDSTYTPMALRIYKNENESFIPFDVISCIPCEGWFDLTAATWADYDSDGDMDILLAGTHNPGTGNIEGRARIYTNDNGVFTESGNELPAPRAAGDRGGTFSWFDLDSDGDLDYFIAGQYFVPGGNGLVEAQMHVYRNDVPALNEAPSLPIGLNAVVQPDNSVTLSWLPSTDDHTPGPAITYDLVIVRNGTHVPVGDLQKVGQDIITRLPEPGNISAVVEWSLAGLTDGQYQWQLRAVDAAYVGSQVALGEFNIGVVSVDGDNELPFNFSLEQNYPNPFNPATTIKYSIPSSGQVTLKIFDALGEQVALLINEYRQAGNYILSFDGKNLSSGVYFYQLTAGNLIDTKKMILMK
jgi:PKD repeat protein